MKRKHENGDIVKIHMQAPMTTQEFIEGEALLIRKIEENETHEKWLVKFTDDEDDFYNYYERWVKK